MIAVDTSALVSVFLGEPDRDVFIDALGSARDVCVSVASLLECTIVLQARHGDDGVALLTEYLRDHQPESVAVDTQQLAVAQRAAVQFGRGRHPAALNFGDCFSYALARTREVPLLFKGNDFSQTDVVSALAVG